MARYEKLFEIPDFLCDEQGKLRLSYILGYATEVSQYHEDKVIPQGLLQNRFWVLYTWRFHFLEPIFGKKKIRLRTWISKNKGFFSWRELDGWSEEDKLLFMASSRWLFLDKESRKPIRIPQEIIEAYGIEDKQYFPQTEKINPSFSWDREEVFIVEKEDLDRNGHMNNAAYLKKALSFYNRDFTLNHQVRSLMLMYQKESLYQEKINLRLQRGEEDIFAFAKEDEVRAQVKIQWKKSAS